MNQEKTPLIANLETVNALCDMFVEVINRRDELQVELKHAYILFAFELYARNIIPLDYLKDVSRYLDHDAHILNIAAGLYED